MESSNINEAFEHQIKKVLETQNFGVSRKPIELCRISCSGKQKADRFKFSIPYANNTLNWTVMFDSAYPEMGPDFEFHDDSFLVDPDVDTVVNHVPSLAKWHAIDSDSLLNVLGELVQYYKHYQINLLSRSERRLHAEYTKLIENYVVSSKDVEIIILPDADSFNEARFVVHLDMDFSRLPGHTDKTIHDAAMIVLTFQPINWNRISPRLYLSTVLEQSLCRSDLPPLCIPPLPRDKSMAEYIPEIKKIISDRVTMIADNFEKKSQFIASMLHHQKRNIIEYDAIDFSQITILLEHQDFFFLVHFALEPRFPKDHPIVNLQSIYHLNANSELVNISVQDYPYSPRWEPSEMIRRILEQIINQDAAKLRNMSFEISNRR